MRADRPDGRANRDLLGCHVCGDRPTVEVVAARSLVACHDTDRLLGAGADRRVGTGDCFNVGTMLVVGIVDVTQQFGHGGF
jgi:hypothetical protein